MMIAEIDDGTRSRVTWYAHSTGLWAVLSYAVEQPGCVFMGPMARSLSLLCAVFVSTCSLMAYSIDASAQARSKNYRLGVLANDEGSTWDAFRARLRELGYIEGHNTHIEWRFAGGDADRQTRDALDLVRHRVDIIVASGNQAVRAAKEATSTIPIVMAVSGSPDKLGFVQSLGRPGGNVTGLTNLASPLQRKRFELLKEFAPRAARAVWLWTPENVSYREEDVREAAAAAGLQVDFVELRTFDSFAAAFNRVLQTQPHVLVAVANPLNFKGRKLIAEFALKHRLATIFEDRIFVEAGGLMSYAPNYKDLFRDAADYVDQILRGAKPAELPVQQPQNLELVINLGTARALGLTLPPSLRLRATLLFE